MTTATAPTPPDTRDIEVNGRRFILTKMTALIASRIHNWLFYAGMKTAAEMQQSGQTEMDTGPEPTPDANPQLRAEFIVSNFWVMASSVLSEETLAKIQNYALRSVLQVVDEATGVTAPVVMADGRWAAAGVGERDAVAVSLIITRSLQFNLAPFFIEGLKGRNPAKTS